jgi:hypothetical protein
MLMAVVVAVVVLDMIVVVEQILVASFISSIRDSADIK